jgi:outer membrane protein OmpA-like peptidoglycan-associated protein
MRTIITLLFALFTLAGFSQTITLEKENITPKGISTIGGISYFKGQLYLLLPANIRYKGKEAEASESKTISEKYRVFDIYRYDQTIGELVNMSKKWPTPDASPNGFCIVDDSTVVYTNNKSQLISNSNKLNTILSKINSGKFHFTDPFWHEDSKQIYFSANLPGSKGGMDIWHIETEGKNSGDPINSGALNSTYNELSPSCTNDTLLIFVSDRDKKQYDIFLYNRLENKVLQIEETLAENEFFTLSPTSRLIYFVSSKEKKQSLWKGIISTRQIEKVENIAPIAVQEIPFDTKHLPEHEMIKFNEKRNDDPDFKLTNYFGLARYDLTPIMKDSLDRIARMLGQNTELNIVICGHASPDGPENRNMMLSYYRANEAYRWLIEKGISSERIFRIYGGEYLYNDSVKARMFSIFPINETDIPKQITIIPSSLLGKPSKLYPIYGTNSDESDYLRFILKKQLPIYDQALLLLPVKTIHYVLKGETVYSISKQHDSNAETIIRANNMNDEIVSEGKVLLIPEKNETND